MNAIYLYRIGNWFYRHRVPLVPRLVRLLIFLLYNSDIFMQTKIGRGTRFAHGGIGVVIHAETVIGEQVMIGPHVVIGGNFRNGVATIGNHVWISAGAKLIGEITIGSNVIIGANAVVLHDVPDNSVVAGVPAKVLREITADERAFLA